MADTVIHEPEPWYDGTFHQRAPNIAGTVLHYETDAPWYPTGHPKDTSTPDGYGRHARNLKWVDADHQISGRLTMDDGIHSGRSAKYVSWTHDDGRNFPMFVAELVKLIKTGDVKPGGILTGDFRVVKRGNNYGIEYLP